MVKEIYPLANPDLFIVDEPSGRHYLNQPLEIVHIKCCLLVIGTPFVHAVASLVNIVYRILKLVTLYHFWMPKDQNEGVFSSRLKDAGVDVLRIFGTPLALVGLELSAIYGACSPWKFAPYNGRKLYASFERALYGKYILAPCFQPNAQVHLFRGAITDKEAF
jgi:hypothetical protein